MTVAIQPNDDPHGTVEFERDEFIVHEMEDDVLQWVKVVRRSVGHRRCYTDVDEYVRM